MTLFALNAHQFNIQCCTDISVQRELTHASVNTKCELTHAVFYTCVT